MLRGKARFLVMLAAIATLSYAPSYLVAGFLQPIAGVVIDADGVLRTKVMPDPDGRLRRARQQAAQAALQGDIAHPSKLRKISLKGLEAALAQRLQNGELETDEMKYLAGLTRITHVFCYPESQDIVIAGPAEGFMLDLAGRPVGVQSGRATLLLEDLIVALRAFPSTGERTQVISVSIDPTQEGLARLQQAVAQASTVDPRGKDAQFAAAFKSALGMQKVTIRGVSPKTHFAQVLVEADYRMKLIGIGLETPPVKITSYVARANPRDVARNAMQRWYFTPNYDAVKTSDDRLAMELIGQGVKLVSEDEMVVAGGVRVGSDKVNPASKAFTDSFTAQYERLADQSPVYAQLRNLIDLAIAAAYIQDQDFYAQASWDAALFRDESRFAVETNNAPQQVESAVNALWKNRRLMTPIGGGVNIQPREALTSERLQADANGELGGLREQLRQPGVARENWWWD